MSNQAPEHLAAHWAVHRAVYAGILPTPHEHKCHACNNRASLYHHESYEPEHRLAVIPLCRRCHRNRHVGHIQLDISMAITP